MGSIFKNSSLNIAAEELQDCHDRILGPRHLAFPPIEIIFTISKRGIKGAMFIRL